MVDVLVGPEAAAEGVLHNDPVLQRPIARGQPNLHVPFGVSAPHTRSQPGAVTVPAALGVGVALLHRSTADPPLPLTALDLTLRPLPAPAVAVTPAPRDYRSVQRYAVLRPVLVGAAVAASGQRHHGDRLTLGSFTNPVGWAEAHPRRYRRRAPLPSTCPGRPVALALGSLGCFPAAIRAIDPPLLPLEQVAAGSTLARPELRPAPFPSSAPVGPLGAHLVAILPALPPHALGAALLANPIARHRLHDPELRSAGAPVGAATIARLAGSPHVLGPVISAQGHTDDVVNLCPVIEQAGPVIWHRHPSLASTWARTFAPSRSPPLAYHGVHRTTAASGDSGSRRSVEPMARHPRDLPTTTPRGYPAKTRSAPRRGDGG